MSVLDQKDDQNAIGIIIKLGKLLAHLRGVVPTWETRESQGLEYAYTFANIEEPDRAMVQLRNLAPRTCIISRMKFHNYGRCPTTHKCSLIDRINGKG
jgi:hypothetical protein